MDRRRNLDLPRWRGHAFQAMTIDPVLIAYAVKRSGRGKKAIWSRIGQAYPHETSAGLTVILDAVPPDGRVVLLERDEADDERLAREAERRFPRSARRQNADVRKRDRN
jgi:hypothetical protein